MCSDRCMSAHAVDSMKGHSLTNLLAATPTSALVAAQNARPVCTLVKFEQLVPTNAQKRPIPPRICSRA